MFYTGLAETFNTGDSLVYGDNYEVVGPATGEEVSTFVEVQFPGGFRVECPLDSLSRAAPPPLPGGYRVFDEVFYTGASFTYPDGDRYRVGDKGEVVGPVDDEDEAVSVMFPGNKESIDILLTELNRTAPPAAEEAAPAAAADDDSGTSTPPPTPGAAAPAERASDFHSDTDPEQGVDFGSDIDPEQDGPVRRIDVMHFRPTSHNDDDDDESNVPQHAPLAILQQERERNLNDEEECAGYKLPPPALQVRHEPILRMILRVTYRVFFLQHTSSTRRTSWCLVRLHHQFPSMLTVTTPPLQRPSLKEAAVYQEGGSFQGLSSVLSSPRRARSTGPKICAALTRCLGVRARYLTS